MTPGHTIHSPISIQIHYKAQQIMQRACIRSALHMHSLVLGKGSLA